MDILIYEHILGGGCNENPSPAILNEAKLIVRSLVDDFTREYPDSKISLLTNKKNKNILSNISLVFIDHSASLIFNIVSNIKKNDKVLILAPEENEIMYKIVKDLESEKISLINCSSDFIYKTTYKVLTNNNLINSNKYIIKIYSSYKNIDKNQSIVAKSNDGLGAEKLFIFKNREDLENNEKKLLEKHIFQEYIIGDVVGINIISSFDKINILSVNKQVYKKNSKNEIFLEKIIFGEFNNMIDIFEIFVRNILGNFSGFYGFIGIDAIITNDKKILFLEINPRLTTSYIGLHKTLGFNPIKLLYKQDYNYDVKDNKVFSVDITNDK